MTDLTQLKKGQVGKIEKELNTFTDILLGVYVISYVVGIIASFYKDFEFGIIALISGGIIMIVAFIFHGVIRVFTRISNKLTDIYQLLEERKE